jgi:hypothetical protein
MGISRWRDLSPPLPGEVVFDVGELGGRQGDRIVLAWIEVVELIHPVQA